MEDSITELTQREKKLIERYFGFYRTLATGERLPGTNEQEHFVAMCEGRAKAETEHELAYVKHMKILRVKQDAEKGTNEGIPDYEDGTPRPDWCTDSAWKKMRSGNYADMKQRQRGG